MPRKTSYYKRKGGYKKLRMYKSMRNSYGTFTGRGPSMSGRAPRVSYISRTAIDVILGNQANAVNGFTLYNTNGVVQNFDDMQVGLTQSSFANTQRFPLSMVYQVDQLSAWPEISRLYSQYRIRGVKVTIIPMSNTSNVSGLASAGECVFAHDYADATTVTDENELLQMQGVKTRRLDKPFSWFIRPRARTATYDATGTATAAGAQMNSPWLDSLAAGDAAHYGTKLYFNNIYNNGTATSNVSFKIRRTFYIEVKDTT